VADQLRLECLGGMQITRAGIPLTGFVSVKAPALLCYLAVTGRPQFRLVVAGLLWGDLPEEDACANLRKVLSNLRDLAGDYLIITPHTVAFDRQSAYWLDVREFLERVDRDMRGQRGGEIRKQGAAGQTPVSLFAPSVSTHLPHLHEAADLYRGDFLDGFYVRHAPLFEEWVLGQREGLRHLAEHVLQQLAEHHAGQGELDLAIDFTLRLLALDPWQEDAHRQLMALWARRGDRNAALAQYETCRRLLASELGVEPMAATTALYRRIRAIGAPRPHNLPAPVTTFVGREAELALIAARLADPNCRLLSILGLGGVGKTRLALEATSAAQAQVSDAFIDGVYFVPLPTVHSTRGLATAIAAALGLPLSPGADPQAVLLHHLSDRELLLVLDGFEHLVAEAGFLATLLAHAPRVKLLVTSQWRLNLSGEWVIELGGLPYPPLGATGDIETFGALQLLIQRARQADPTLELSAMDIHALTLICELLEGLPLAIELAASWAGRRRILEIAQAIEGGLDALVAFQRDLPARHRSMEATFEYSWRLLSPSERQVLRRLAVFRGGFTQEAAERIAEADRIVLTAMTDRSLLRRTRSGRYEMHELLRLFAAERLAETPADDDATRERHAHFYLGESVAQREVKLCREEPPAELESLHAESGNLAAAWVWAVERGLDREVSASTTARAPKMYVGDPGAPLAAPALP
jgi:DNA-binding SARP family transcriptional activator/predicted ATPase